MFGFFSETSKEPEDSVGVPGEEDEDLGEASERDLMAEPQNEPRSRGRKEAKEANSDIFAGKEHIRKKDIILRFDKKASHKIPGSTRWYKRQERKDLAEELFARAAAISGKKDKEFMTREELKTVMKKLRKEGLSGSLEEKIRAKEKIKWLERELGFFDKK